MTYHVACVCVCQMWTWVHRRKKLNSAGLEKDSLVYDLFTMKNYVF